MFSRPILRSLAPRTLKAPQQPSASILSRFSRFQQRDLSQQAKEAIDDAIKASPLVVFMKGNPAQPQCGFSRAVVQILDVQGVPMEKMHTYNCLDDQELREGIKEYSDWPTIPQVYLKGEFLGGCDILMGMHSSGELEELLVKEGIISLEEELSDGSAEPEKKD